MKIFKKNSIKIPKNIKIIYLSNENFIVLIGPLGKKCLKLKLNLLIHKLENLVYVTKELNTIFSGKKLEAFQGTTIALLKQSILEVSVILYKKLKLVGVGYRISAVHNVVDSILHFKLGFSHPVFFKFDSSFKIVPFKTTNLYIYGNSYNSVTQLASTIRSYKRPEPYKGKGILYQNEKIKKKEGKKV